MLKNLHIKFPTFSWLLGLEDERLMQFQKEENAILKSALKSSSDNLYYEYLVGMNFLNNACTIFSCFLETYGYFSNTGGKLYNKMLHTNSITKSDINNSITSIPNPNPNVYKTIRDKSKYLSLLIESLNGLTLKKYITKIIIRVESTTL